MLQIVRADRQRIATKINQISESCDSLSRQVESGSIPSYSQVESELRQIDCLVEAVISIVEEMAKQAFDKLK